MVLSVTMALKALLFLLASFLIVNTRVSTQNEEHFMEGPLTKLPHVAPTKSPLKAPPPPSKVTVKSPPPSPPVKPPQTPLLPPPSPPVKPPQTPLLPPPSPLVKPPQAPLPPPPPAYSPPRPPRTRLECMPPCGVRCKFHSRKNVCIRACLACCERCKCVPPGQSGNRMKCGKCYANMTTRGGKLKCP